MTQLMDIKYIATVCTMYYRAQSIVYTVYTVVYNKLTP